MPGRKPKAGTVITSLFENEKRRLNNHVDDSDDDVEKRKKSKKGKEDDSMEKTFNCHICHSEDPTLPKLSAQEIKFLEDNDQIMLKYKTGKDIKILCKNHYKDEVLNFMRREKCCNILNRHKGKARKTDLRKITVRQADDAMTYLGLKMIPFLHICKDCIPKLDMKIEEAKMIEDEPYFDDNAAEIEEEQVEKEEIEENEENEENEGVEELEIGTVKHDILRNIAAKVENFSKEQKIAIVSVLPASWTTNEIATNTGKITVHCTYSGALKHLIYLKKPLNT